MDKPDPAEKEKILVGEACRILEVCSATLRSWDEAGKLAPIGRLPNGRRYYYRDQIVSFMKKNPNYRYLRVGPRKSKGGKVEEV